MITESSAAGCRPGRRRRSFTGPVSALAVLLCSALALAPAHGRAMAARAEQAVEGKAEEGEHRLVGLTSRGSWRVEVRTEPSPIPLNELFTVDVRVTLADDPESLVEGAVVTASSWMPDHNHGATLQPQVTSHGDGTARGVGFLFHMPGRWELRLGIAVDGAMERVALSVDLEP